MDDNRYPRTATPQGVISEIARPRAVDGVARRRGYVRPAIGIDRRARPTFLRRTADGDHRFNAWGTLRQMTVPDSGQHGPPTLNSGADPRDTTMTRFLREAPATGSGPERDRGVPGAISYGTAWPPVRTASISRCATTGSTRRITAPALMIAWCSPAICRSCRGRAGTFNMLHVCGKALDFRRFAAYPGARVQLGGPLRGTLDRRGGPLGAAGTLRRVSTIWEPWSTAPRGLCPRSGRRHSPSGRSAADCAPGCTFDPEPVPAENLHAIRQAVEREHSA